MEFPHRWVVLKIGEIYKVLGAWRGSYLEGESWRLNSGIVNVTKDNDNFIFHGHSGSQYVCHKDCYGTSTLSYSIFEQIKELEPSTCILVENTDWLKLLD